MLMQVKFTRLKFFWIKANQLFLLKCGNYEDLSKNLTLKSSQKRKKR